MKNGPSDYGNPESGPENCQQLGLDEMKTEGPPAVVNGRIRRGLRSEPSLERGWGGATGWLWMWRRRRYCPSPHLVSMRGRRGRSSQFALGAAL